VDPIDVMQTETRCAAGGCNCLQGKLVHEPTGFTETYSIEPGEHASPYKRRKAAMARLQDSVSDFEMLQSMSDQINARLERFSCKECLDTGWGENYHGDGSVNRRWRCECSPP